MSPSRGFRDRPTPLLGGPRATRTPATPQHTKTTKKWGGVPAGGRSAPSRANRGIVKRAVGKGEGLTLIDARSVTPEIGSQYEMRLPPSWAADSDGRHCAGRVQARIRHRVRRRESMGNTRRAQRWARAGRGSIGTDPIRPTRFHERSFGRPVKSRYSRARRTGRKNAQGRTLRCACGEGCLRHRWSMLLTDRGVIVRARLRLSPTSFGHHGSRFKNRQGEDRGVLR